MAEITAGHNCSSITSLSRSNHSKNASLLGRRSISKLHALRSCWMRFQYESAIASGLSNGSLGESLYLLRTLGVSMMPSIMTCATWMPSGHSSTARDCASPRTANSAPLNATAPPRPRTDEVVPVKMIVPVRRFSISGTASREQECAEHRDSP
jgi:hypothetical protein